MLYNQQSGIGLLQVMDLPWSRLLLINGVIQGQMGEDGRALSPYIHSMNALTAAHHAHAATALQLGLGAGLLPKELTRRGVKVTAVEIEPRIATLADKFFGLPKEVDVRIADARAFLRHDEGKYDLVLLDTFASESTPWHMLTVEAFREMRDRLNPAGRLIINTVSFADPKRPALEGIESSLRAVFSEVMIYTAVADSNDPEELVNVLIVAGENLTPKVDPRMDGPSQQRLRDLLSRVRPARPDAAPVCTDDRSNLDYAQAAMRIRWRRFIWDSLSSNLLWD
jgi:spermidine synthase